MDDKNQEIINLALNKGIKELIGTYDVIPVDAAIEIAKEKPTVLFSDSFVKHVELDVRFAKYIIKTSTYSIIFNSKFIQFIDSDTDILNELLDKISRSRLCARYIDCDKLKDETVKKIINTEPTAVINMRHTTFEQDYLAFKLMDDDEKYYFFTQLRFVDNALFHADFSKILIEDDEEFMTFIIKTMIILKEGHAYNPIYNENAPKLEKYLEENFSKYEKLKKRAIMEMKFDPEQKKHLDSSIMPF